MEHEEGFQEISPPAEPEEVTSTSQQTITDDGKVGENVSEEPEAQQSGVDDENDNSDREDLLTMLADAAVDQSSYEDLSKVSSDLNATQDPKPLVETNVEEVVSSENSTQIENQTVQEEEKKDKEDEEDEEDKEVEEDVEQAEKQTVEATQEEVTSVKQEEAEVSQNEETPPEAVRIRSASSVIEDAINFGEREGRQIIVSGTLNKLVEHVAYEGDMQGLFL